MFEKEEASIRPDTVRGDTQAQSTTVFGLAHLLGISLMPRIRNWKDLTFLRKLGTYSRKNKLYQAFQELGRVIRTHFLLHYLGDPELRSTIQSATNKSEAFNGFAKWAFFGGEGVITHNRRVEQRKCIKFNHLVANCLIFYNVHVVSEVLEQLNQEGAKMDEQAVGALSPYLRQHINRFGEYQLDLTQPPLP